MRVILTGFGPFPRAPFNPSAALVTALARRRRPALAQVTLLPHVFATTYAAIDRELPRLFALRPDIVLMFGLAARTRHLRIEMQARNAVALLVSDASGRRPAHDIIAAGGPAALKGRAPFARLLGAVRSHATSARLSRDAGCYVCNYAYWRALQHARSDGPLVQFVHVPLVRPKQWRRHSTRRSLPLRELVPAAEALLIALLAANRR